MLDANTLLLTDSQVKGLTLIVDVDPSFLAADRPTPLGTKVSYHDEVYELIGTAYEGDKLTLTLTKLS